MNHDLSLSAMLWLVVSGCNQTIILSEQSVCLFVIPCPEHFIDHSEQFRSLQRVNTNSDVRHIPHRRRLVNFALGIDNA